MAQLVLVSCRKDVAEPPAPPPPPALPDPATPLKNLASFPVGVAVSHNSMINDALYAAIVQRDFDAVTFENEMKHGSIVQNNGNLDFSKADALVNAVSGLQIFGHTLAWHSGQNATYLRNFAGMVVPGGSELLSNNDFELGGTTFDNWSTFNSANGATVTVGSGSGEVRTGLRSLKVVNPVANPGNQWRVQVASDLFNTVAGKQYIITYWVKAATAGGSIRLSTGPTAQYQPDQTIGTAWQQVTWTISANSAQTRILFDMGQSANTYFIDDVSVKEAVASSDPAQVAAKLDVALNQFITAMVNRYKSKVNQWDVVNELFAEDGNIRNNTNTSNTASDVLVWSHYMGRDFAYKAFQYAAAADPSATLFINDYNLESRQAKLDSLVKFVGELKTRGLKIDGIGTQMHISLTTQQAGIDAMFSKLAATGLKIRISELDVRTGSSGGAPTEQQLTAQANMVKYVVASYLRNVPKAQQAGITLWGVTDNTSWLYNNRTEFPLLYDKNYQRKPAYAAFVQALAGM
jgi:endo-1,4-beta-xylanase